MANTRILCIFTTLLGHKTSIRKVMDVLDRLPGLEPTYLVLGAGDYAQYPAPWWARATDPWEAQFIARRRARPFRERQFDLLFVNAWELTVAFRDLARRLPAVAMMDSVPSTVDAQLRRRGMQGGKRWLSHQVHHRAFARAAREFDLFLPEGSDCAQSLQRDYGIEAERCFVTLTPQDLDASKPASRAYAPPLRLLFVGNDFERKGGDFLLRLYSDHLAGTSTLTIVSADPALTGRQLPAGVERLGPLSIEQLRPVYRDSHLFLFPTRQDYMPRVLAEALTFGLPCISTDVGGIGDLVHNGETGFLMPPDASPEAWAAHIHRLAGDPAELGRMSACARRFAEEKLGLDRFAGLIAEVVDRLRARRAAYGAPKIG